MSSPETEKFKKAFTDAVIGAMRRRGLSAGQPIPEDFPSMDELRAIACEVYCEGALDMGNLVADHYSGVPRELAARMRRELLGVE